MKKFFALAFSALLVLGFAASAFAIHAEIPDETTAAIAKGSTLVTIGGNMRSRFEYCENCSDADDDSHDHWTRWDNRGRLNITAKVAENATGYLSLERFYVMGDGASSQEGSAGVYTTGNQRAGAMEILENWIQFTGLGPLSFKIGHMPLALGNKTFFDHTLKGDDALIVWMDPAEGVHVAGLVIQLDEGSSLASPDDAQAYVLLGTYGSDMFNLGGDVTWVNDNRATVGGDLNLYNIGVYGDVNAGPAKIWLDGQFQTGDFALAPGVDSDFGGYAVRGGAKMKAGGVNLGLEGGVGSGQDLTSTSTDTDLFITSLNGRVPYIAFVYDTRITGASGTTGAGISNLTYVKGSVGGAISDALSYKAALMWLMASEDVPTRAGNLDDDLGIEIDASANYKLARNLRTWVEGGYFLVGDVYEKTSGSSGDDVFAIRIGTELSF